jgi:hypothetical protein
VPLLFLQFQFNDRQESCDADRHSDWAPAGQGRPAACVEPGTLEGLWQMNLKPARAVLTTLG